MVPYHFVAIPFVAISFYVLKYEPVLWLSTIDFIFKIFYLSQIGVWHDSTYYHFKLRPCGLVIAPGLHPLHSETASHVSECLRFAGHRTD